MRAHLSIGFPLTPQSSMPILTTTCAARRLRLGLTSLTAEVATLDSALAIPSELPILLVAGALDPVGNKGRGVKSTAALFKKAGIKDVEVKLYQGMRHEILNEPGKQQVYDDVLAWIDRHIS